MEGSIEVWKNYREVEVRTKNKIKMSNLKLSVAVGRLTVPNLPVSTLIARIFPKSFPRRHSLGL